MLCGEATLLGADERSLLVRPLRCKCWHCDECREWLQSRLIAIALAGEPTTMLTLTSNPNYEPDPDRAAERLLHAWQKLSRKYRKLFGRRGWAYLGIWEKTQAGMPHLHILLRSPWIDQRAISSFMEAEIQAPIVDIRRIDNTKMVVRYVAKYVGKQPAKFANRTRFARSHNWLDTPTARERSAQMPHTYGWHLKPQSVDHWLAVLAPEFEIEPERDGFRLTRRDGSVPWSG